MRVVRVEPAGVDIPVDDGETLMAAAVRAGYRWPTVCGGQAQCGAQGALPYAALPGHDPETLIKQGGHEAGGP